MKRLLRWLKRGAIALALLLLTLAIAGAIWEGVAGAADRRKYPAPGRLVDVEGHRMHIRCDGQGTPTVILETGAFSMSSSWRWIQPPVATHTRVCSYDRAGLGWSEPGPRPRDTKSSAAELHTLLVNAGERPPYVLVGYSYGGPLIRMYASQYADEAVGLLFMDSSHPDQDARFEEVMGKQRVANALGRLAMYASPTLARLGLSRAILAFPPVRRAFEPDSSSQATDETIATFSSAAHTAGSSAEMREWSNSMAQVRALGDLGDRPVIVMTAGRDEESGPAKDLWFTLQREIAALSTRNTRRVVAGATHFSMSTRREHATQVADGIRELVDSVRAAVRAIAVKNVDRPDAYIIRNFGELLRKR